MVSHSLLWLIYGCGEVVLILNTKKLTSKSYLTYHTKLYSVLIKTQNADMCFHEPEFQPEGLCCLTWLDKLLRASQSSWRRLGKQCRQSYSRSACGGALGARKWATEELRCHLDMPVAKQRIS